ncbi:alpha/beta-hydrolase [Mycena pura]|uniref:Alpha/beta-hydrolase n=1 Tax=Mycena pura TaxID=153505 RepID=A0AAD6Y386_9AGAR|nr:alpha/beta-hydrolase [Mycena pura]
MHKLLALAVLSLLLHSASTLGSASPPFAPRAYPKSTATCRARNRAEEKDVDIALRFVDVNPGAKTTLLMVHGWPSLWSTWSNQIQEFEKDYRLIVPDLRGFGESTHPGDVRSSGTLPDMVDDMVCVLKHAGVSSAVCIGHDWGSQICYRAARMRPDLFRAVVGIAVPYLPSVGDFVPMESIVGVFPKIAYQVYFDKHTADAVSELDRDVRRTVRSTLRTVASPPPDAFLRSTTSFLEAWGDVAEIPPVPFFSPDEEDYFVEQYTIQGFKYTLQFYMEENQKLSRSYDQAQGNLTIPQPVLAILPKEDPVGDWAVAMNLFKSADFLPNSKTEFMDGAHWCHVEYPAAANALMRAWLKELVGDGGVVGHDEL